MSNRVIPIVPELTSPLDTVCDLKWNYPIFNLARGEFRSCCRTPSKRVDADRLKENGIEEFLNSKEMIQSRLDLMQGIKHEDCVSCWKLEERGMASPRHSPEQFYIQLQRKYVDSNTPYTPERLLEYLSTVNEDSEVLRSYHPYMLEISLGNTCDMKCMYCNHHYSTQWGTERIKYGEITQEQYDNEFPKAPEGFEEKFWEWFDKHGRKFSNRIGVIGGEPLIMPEFYSMLDRLLDGISKVSDVRKSKATLWIVTNMNTPPQYLEKFFKYLPKITEVCNLEILVSMESVGPRAEYIRNGVNWDRFVSNIDKLLSKKDLNFDFGFIMSQNALSIASIKEFIQFTESLYFKYNRPVALKHNIVSFPSWQNPMILTPDFADYIDDCIEYMKCNVDMMPEVNDYFGRYDQYIVFLEELSKSIKNNQGDYTEDRKKFVPWFKVFDERRNLNLLETFPEYRNFYKMCEQLNG